jgi:phospholipase C
MEQLTRRRFLGGAAAASGFAGRPGAGYLPWSRGGWVSSEAFDHTSIIRFCEKLFGVYEPNISAWRRRAVGDLTSALRFRSADLPPLNKLLPMLPEATALYNLEVQEVATLPAPQVPAVEAPPHQEPGRRPHPRPRLGPWRNNMAGTTRPT